MANEQWDDVDSMIDISQRRQFDNNNRIDFLIKKSNFEKSYEHLAFMLKKSNFEKLDARLVFILEKSNFEKLDGRLVFILEKSNFLKKYNRYIQGLKNVGVTMARKGISCLRRVAYRFPAVYRFLVKIGAKRMYNRVKLKIKGMQKYE